MRGVRRTHRREEEEESVFISMSDMTISFLFIMMILLAFFASQFTVSDTVPRAQYNALGDEKVKLEAELKRVQEITGAPDQEVVTAVQAMKDELERLRKLVDRTDAPNLMEVYNAGVAETRKQLLIDLKNKITQQIPNVSVSVSSNFDALQFRGDGLFDSGSDTPTAAGAARMKQIATILDTNLGCFSLGPRKTFREDCNSGYALIDALQVEGHTDNVGGESFNMDLSAKRAASTYSLMTQQQPDLVLYQNREQEPVLSVAGFGKGRPIQTNDTKAGQDANRRIDLRFIMVVPSKEADIENIKRELQGLRR